MIIKAGGSRGARNGGVTAAGRLRTQNSIARFLLGWHCGGCRLRGAPNPDEWKMYINCCAIHRRAYCPRNTFKNPVIPVIKCRSLGDTHSWIPKSTKLNYVVPGDAPNSSLWNYTVRHSYLVLHLKCNLHLGHPPPPKYPNPRTAHLVAVPKEVSQWDTRRDVCAWDPFAQDENVWFTALRSFQKYDRGAQCESEYYIIYCKLISMQ